MNARINFILNNREISCEVNPAITVLDYLRSELKLTGTKEGCREGDCGACTVLVGSIELKELKYKSVNSCLLPIASMQGKHLVTIEGLNQKELTSVQSQMVMEGGTQCGFCTPGFVISITNYFLTKKKYDLKSAVNSLDGNICRCTGYAGIKRAVENVIDELTKKTGNGKSGLGLLVEANIIPEYFLSIKKRLKKLNSRSNILKIKKSEKPEYLVSGGTDLYVQKWETLYESKVHFLRSSEQTRKIRKEGNKIIVNASATIEEFGSSEIILKYFPQLDEWKKLFGSLPIRNRATIAGNIVNASPIADAVNVLLALNAEVVLEQNNKKRKIFLSKFYLGYKQVDLKPGEVVSEIIISIPQKGFMFSYEKVSRRTYLDIASVNTSLSITIKHGKVFKSHLSAGGVAPIPLHLAKTSSLLLDKEISFELIDLVCDSAEKEISPISDARGSKEYKALLLRQLIKAHFLKMFPQLARQWKAV